MRRSVDSGSIEPEGLLGRLDNPALDRWIAPRAQPDEDREQILRTRILASVVLGLGAFSLAFAVFDVLTGLYALSVPLFVGAALSVSSMLALRRSGDHRVAGSLLTVGFFIVVLGNAVFNDGLEAAILVFLSFVPLMAMMFAGVRAGQLWLGVCVATILGVYAAESAGFGFWQTMDLELVPLNLAMVLLALTLAVFGAFRLQHELATWLGRRLVAARNERTRQILDAAGDAILEVDGARRVVAANRAARALFDLPSLVGTSVSEILPDLALQHDTTGSARCSARGGLEPVPVEAIVTPLEDGHVLVVRDIREHLRVQAELEAARDRAMASDVAKTRFLAAMSHELRTPLNAVIGYAEMMRDDIDEGDPVDDPRDLLRIVEAARHLLSLIDQVLDLAKVESGRLQMECAPVDLPALVRELDSVGEALAAANHNTWTCRTEGLQPGLLSDALRLKQVVLNLIANAAKFTEHGEVELVVWCDDDGVCFRVRDTGIGLSEAQQERIWEVFEQADTSTSRRYGGTGLGLPLSQRMTERMGGRITVESAEGIGSTFTLCLPWHPPAS
jgi:signal transduction histidine kinase